MPVPMPPVTIPLILLLAAGVPLPGMLSAEVTSDHHPTLERALQAFPQGDADGDGRLSLAEYAALRESTPEDSPLAARLPEVHANGEVLVREFEDKALDEVPRWTRDGDAFARDLGHGTRLMRNRLGSFRGHYVLTTFTGSEEATGHLRSPPFLLELDYLLVTMSGGCFPGEIAVNLRIDDRLVGSATGSNDDFLETVAFDLRAFRGRLATLELVDLQKGPWGHLTVDRIVQSTDRRGARLADRGVETSQASAGAALTTDGTSEGPFAVEDGELRSPEGPLPFHHVLLVTNPAADEPPAGAGGTLRLRSGERWRVDIGDLQGDHLEVRIPGQEARQVLLDRIASIEFQDCGDAPPGVAGTLYRTNGEPLPGKLIWIRAKDIAIDCPLGIVPIPRGVVQRFVVTDAAQAPAGGAHDTLELADGSLWFGTASLEDDRVVFAHRELGTLSLPWTTVRSLRRSLPGLHWLHELPREVVSTSGPGLPPPAPTVIKDRKDSSTRLRIHPNTTIRFPGSGTDSSPRRLAGRLSLTPDSVAHATVRISAANTLLWERSLSPSAPVVDLTLTLNGPGDFTVAVEFDGPVAFPAAVDVLEARLVPVPPHGTNPSPAETN